MGNNKITLGDKMRVKINKIRVSAPYADKFVNVTKTQYSTVVQTYLGVKIVWDGNNFLEVSVPTSFKGKIRKLRFFFERSYKLLIERNFR